MHTDGQRSDVRPHCFNLVYYRTIRSSSLDIYDLSLDSNERRFHIRQAIDESVGGRSRG